MPIIGQTFPQLIDAFKGNTPGQVIELLSVNNPILDDAIATQCNMDAVHRHTIRTGLPTVAWGRLYQGVPQSKATLQQVDDTTGFMETSSIVDVRLLQLASDPAKMRLTEAAPYLEALNQEMATGMFYHDLATTPERFRGLAARYNTYNTNVPNPYNPTIANQVIHGGGSGANNTSIWFVTWADHATTLLYPKNTSGGVDAQDKGEQRVLDASGNPYYVKEMLWRWHVGLAVKDWRYNARIANIDVAQMRAGNVDLWALLRRAYYRLYQTYGVGAKGGRTAIYMNREVLEILDAQSTDRALLTANSNFTGLSQTQVEGRIVRTYRDIPIRMTDAILNTEALVPSIAA